MFSTLPHPISRLIFLFLIASPLLSLASPVPDLTTPDATTPNNIAPRASTRLGRRTPKKVEPLQKKDYSSFLCPASAVACPVVEPNTPVSPESITKLEEGLNSLGDWFTVGFECVELEVELNQCGGCLAFGEGQDCSLIPNTRATGCEKSSCAVYSCFEGYTVSPDRQSCIKKGTVAIPDPTTVISATPVVAVAEGEQAVLGLSESSSSAGPTGQ